MAGTERLHPLVGHQSLIQVAVVVDAITVRQVRLKEPADLAAAATAVTAPLYRDLALTQRLALQILAVVVVQRLSNLAVLLPARVALVLLYFHLK